MSLASRPARAWGVLALGGVVVALAVGVLIACWRLAVVHGDGATSVLVFLLLVAGLALGGRSWLLGRLGSREAALRHAARGPQASASRHREDLARFSNEAILLADRAQTLVEVNEQACSLYGCSRQALLGRSLRDLRPPELRTDQDEELDPSRAATGIVYETRHARRDGSLFDAEISLRSIGMDGATYFQAVVRDVSERIRAEAERARLAAMVEGSLDEIYVFEPESLRFSYVNQGACTNLGYDAPSLATMTPLDLKPDFDLESFRSILAPLVEGVERQLVFETRHRRKDGSHYPIEVRLQLVEHRGHRHFLAMIHDTTERHRIEEALREGEEKYRQLWNAESDALFLVDSEDGRILDANPAAESAYGFSRDELLTMRNVDVSAEPAETAAAGASETKRVPVRRHRRKDGTTFPVEISAGRFEWRGRRVHLAAIRDITERVAREHALRLAEERSSALLAAIPDVFLLVDVDGRIVDYRSRSEAVWFMEPERFLGRELQDVLPPEVSERLLPALVRAWQTGSLERVEYRLPATEGEPRLQEARFARTTTGDVVAIIRDVTEERRAEAALRESQKTESLGTLAGGVAHDFNSILGAALARLSLARSALDESDPACRHVDKAALAVERAATLSRQMLDYSGRGHFHLTRLSISDVVNESVGLLQAGVSAAIRIETVLETTLPTVNGDRGQIQQILANLVTNAAEATAPSTGTIVVKTTKRRLSAADRGFWTHSPAPKVPREHVILEVRDSGRGMDEATMERIFDPFFSTKLAGRGLGLPVTLGIVRGHDGGIAVLSRPGSGTTVKIALPVPSETSE